MIEKIIKKLDESQKRKAELVSSMIINNSIEPYMISSLELGNITKGKFKDPDKEKRYSQTLEIIKNNLGYLPDFYSIETQNVIPSGKLNLSMHPVNFFNRKKSFFKE